MSGNLAFWGSADTDDGAAVVAAITGWIGAEGRSKTRMTGLETTWETDDAEAYAHPGSDEPGSAPLYLFEGQVAGAPADGRARLAELLAALRDSGVSASIDYQERDENDDDVGDLETL